MTLQKLPMAMVISRFFAGPVLLWAAPARQSSVWLIGIQVYVFLSDVFDGSIARRLQSVTELHRALLIPFFVPLLAVLALLAVNWALAMAKFHRALSFCGRR